MKAKDYISWYKQSVLPYAQELSVQWKNDAQTLGKLPYNLVERFSEIAFLGKQVRGALFVLGYELGGKKVSADILRASLCIELFHAGILVQDDIMDQDEKRRGMPALHVQFRTFAKELGAQDENLFGESLAVCVSDFAFYRSWELLLSQEFPSEYIVAAGKLLASSIQKLTLGQAMDVANVHTKKVSADEILQIFRYKTAEYTGVLPLGMGAALAGITDFQKLDALETFGRSFGWAFQIQDDILGMFGDKNTGKPVGNDVRNGKMTLLMLELAKQTSAKESQMVASVFGNLQASEEDILSLQTLVRTKGVLKTVIELGKAYCQTGRQVVAHITSDSDKQELLGDLLDFVMTRVA